jgi:hypothetical protein
MPPEASTSGSCKVNFDLKRGVSRVVEKDEESIRQKMLDDLLRWILQERKAEHKNIIDHEHPLRPLLVEFVCYRGLLTLLIATPYECQENWTILATRFQNSIYLWQLKESKKQNGSIAVQKEKSIWGFKFEQYLCASMFSLIYSKSKFHVQLALLLYRFSKRKSESQRAGQYQCRILLRSQNENRWPPSSLWSGS